MPERYNTITKVNASQYQYITNMLYPPEPKPKRYNQIFLTNINYDHIIVLLNTQPSNASINTLVFKALTAHSTIITFN